MPIETTGLKELISKYKKIPQMINDGKRRVLKEYGIKIQRFARNNHRYNNPPHMISKGRQYSPSGNLDRSISYRVLTVKQQKAIALRVYLDPTLITSNGYNYGRIQHDGMGTGFSRSPFSPTGGTTGRNNLKHDWFLYNAFQHELPKMERALKNVPKNVYRKLGL